MEVHIVSRLAGWLTVLVLVVTSGFSAFADSPRFATVPALGVAIGGP
jgi:hypothetical protein